MASSEKVLIIDLNENPENQRILAGKPKTEAQAVFEYHRQRAHGGGDLQPAATACP